MMQTLPGVRALAALAGAALAPLPGKAAKKATAFALIGDRYHNSDYIRIGLTRTIAKETGRHHRFHR